MNLSITQPDTPLTLRAADLLSSGPADAQTLITYVCQLPGAPLSIAEHMATALFAGHRRFTRGNDGRWRLYDAEHSEAAHYRPPPAGLESASFVVVDVEATGSRSLGGDRITEIAAIDVQGGVVTPLIDTLVNPERPIPPFVTRLTHITW